MDKSKKDFKDKKEMRLMELRAVDNEENKMIVEGYAVRFNETTLIGDKDWGWYEVIEPQALNKANMKDVPLKYQHGDTKGVLARTRNKSLTLSDKDWGWYEVIEPQALNKANMKDVPLKYQHGDTKGVLARTRNKSLTLTIDNQGLKIRAEPQALNKANMKDVPLKYQHGDTKGVLARTRNKSLTLTIDNQGLKIRAELIDTQDNIDIYKSIKAGLLYQMSFAFDVVEEEIDRSTNPVTRRIKEIGTLYDVSVVDFGAYPTTSIYARSKEIVGEQLRADRSTNPVTRRIKEIGTLYDVSVVDFGAYPTTSIYARSKEIVGEQLRALQTSLDKDEKETLDNVEERKKLELEKLKAKIRGGLF